MSSRKKGPPPKCGRRLPKGACIRPPGHEGGHLQPPADFSGPEPPPTLFTQPDLESRVRELEAAVAQLQAEAPRFAFHSR